MADFDDCHPFTPQTLHFCFTWTNRELPYPPLYLTPGTLTANVESWQNMDILCFLQNQSCYPKEDTMKSGNRDQAEGMLHQVKGTIKEVAGRSKTACRSGCRYQRSERQW
jgi:hypothetical protein